VLSNLKAICVETKERENVGVFVNVTLSARIDIIQSSSIRCSKSLNLLMENGSRIVLCVRSSALEFLHRKN